MTPAVTRRADRRGAYTLIEMVTAVSILSMILGALASAFVVVGRSMADQGAAASAWLTATAAADQLADELSLATQIEIAGARSVQFFTPDRDDDGAADRVLWSWAGTATSPLVRKRNANQSANVIDAAAEFALTYTTEVDEETGGVICRSVELVLRATQHQSTPIRRSIPVHRTPEVLP